MAEASFHEAFGEELAAVLGRNPAYYDVLVSAEPSRRMRDMVESLALEGDPDDPATTLLLLQELSTAMPEGQIERWLGGLRDAARQSALKSSTAPASLTDRLLQLMYADPALYELMAATEPGYGLLDLVENMALEGGLDDVEAMLDLLRQLARPE